MKAVVMGAHLRRDDVEPLADAIAAGPVVLSALTIADDQPLGDRELLLRVAKVRAELLDRATFIAIRYGFAVTSEADAAGKTAAHAERWRRVLEEQRGNVEMTMKIAAASSTARPDRHDFTTGAAYLKALHAATTAVSVDEDFRALVERELLPLTVRHRWTPRDNQSLELALLIPRERIESVRGAGEAIRAASPHVPFLLSGPWPLEVFADDDHER